LTASSPEHPSFHVVAISLPGYGFSEAPHAKGFDIEQYAEVIIFHRILSSLDVYWCTQVAHKLMLAIGYKEYGASLPLLLAPIILFISLTVTQGGDWGFFVNVS